jgi:L-threonylcarbamoyladenylate synthase
VNLYAAIRRLDGRGLTMIVTQTVPNHGLGRAVNDRLRKASDAATLRPADLAPAGV